jgi:hypothetical protein
MARQQKPQPKPGRCSHQIRMLCGPSGLFGLLVSDELVAMIDGGGNLAISDLGLSLQGF